MSQQPSITSTRSFQARFAEAERWRLGLILVCLAVALAAWFMRRALGGVVASKNEVYIPVVALLGVAILLTAGAMIEAGWRARRGLPIPAWRFPVGLALDLGVPFGVLLILHLESPRGAYAALSPPALLIVPIVIMLSVLRLRPWASIVTGLCAAVMHWSLAASTYLRGAVEPDALPLLFTYGLFLALTGVAAAVIAVFVRRYIREAVAEAEAAEAASRRLAAVQHEMDIARDIQQGLLPSKPPTLAGFDIAGMARPAASAGGDYYDWQPLADGRLVVAIADVTGHGIGPALVMAVCRAYARATAPDIRGAEEFLDRMNALISRDVSGGRFITMGVAIVAPDGAVELLSAGHGPTFLFRAASGEVERFGGDGLPLGVVDSERYTPSVRLRLGSGDALVMLTDGFMERASPSGEQFGIGRLARVIAANAARPAADLIRSIDAEATGFAGGAPQGDDMTVVVVRRV